MVRLKKKREKVGVKKCNVEGCPNKYFDNRGCPSVFERCAFFIAKKK